MASTEIHNKVFVSGELSSNGRLATASFLYVRKIFLVLYSQTASNAFFGHFAYRSPHPADNGAERILYASPTTSALPLGGD